MHSPAASNYEYAAKAAKNRCFPLVEWAAGGQERVGTGGKIEEGEERWAGEREYSLPSEIAGAAADARSSLGGLVPY